MHAYSMLALPPQCQLRCAVDVLWLEELELDALAMHVGANRVDVCMYVCMIT